METIWLPSFGMARVESNGALPEAVAETEWPLHVGWGNFDAWALAEDHPRLPTGCRRSNNRQ